MTVRYALACAVPVLTAALCSAQPSEHADTWFTQNYRFTGPPAPGEIQPTSPVLSELQDIQNTLMSILRKANFAGDYEAALAAAAQAAANARLRASLAERPEPPRPHNTAVELPASSAPVYLIAFRDQSIHAAKSYWSDGRMLHYMTPEGGHEQIRMDLVDRNLSAELNRENKLEFRPDAKGRVARR